MKSVVLMAAAVSYRSRRGTVADWRRGDATDDCSCRVVYLLIKGVIVASDVRPLTALSISVAARSSSVTWNR